jgi:hypothetical protein
LHVLSTPPAFNLSQDQTLHLKILSFKQKEQSNNGPLLDKIWSLGLKHPKDASTRVPTQFTCRIFKQRSSRGGIEGAGSIAMLAFPSTRIFNLGSLPEIPGSEQCRGRAL